MIPGAEDSYKDGKLHSILLSRFAGSDKWVIPMRFQVRTIQSISGAAIDSLCLEPGAEQALQFPNCRTNDRRET